MTYYEKNKDKILLRLNERYQQDNEFREKARETYRNRYHTDQEYRGKTKQRAKERYHTDENYKQATLERANNRNRKMKTNTQSPSNSDEAVEKVLSNDK